MYTCRTILKLKANSAAECASLIWDEVVPLLHRQKGFRAEATFVAQERSEVHANSLWDTREDAEAYARTAHLKVLEILSGVTMKSSMVKILESPDSALNINSAHGGKTRQTSQKPHRRKSSPL
ncbi:MAG TPA: hypothetical protein VFD58_24100 [Blastocatellia bacterium]|nr:hypothetical protein [Blastocatellia bacterium]